MAQNIWDDAFRNTLQKPGRLESYLAANPSSIDTWGGTESLTPLAGACYKGYLEVVTLLLKHGAKAGAPCPNGRTALFYALTQCPQNQLAIVEALLEAGANPNEVYPEDDNSDPLTHAIEESQDKDVVHALIDHGASPTQANETLAKKRKMEQDLRPKAEREKAFTTLANLAVSVVALIVSYTDSGLINATTKGMMKKLYKVTGIKENPVAIEIPQPQTTDDFKKNIGSFVKKAGLEQFFKKKKGFLQTLAEKASALRNDKGTDLGKPENIKRLTCLSIYQLVIYCDDSGSMGLQNRYKHQCELVSRIAKIATMLVPDDVGVELRFINHDSRHTVTTAEIDAAMAAVKPNSGTNIGTNLIAKILKPLVYDKISDPNHEFERPILVCVITDGSPSPEPRDTLQRAVVECRQKLVANKYEPTSVMFCVSQIGNDPDAKDFLTGLDGEGGIKDVLYCTADQLDSKFAEMKENARLLDVWLLEMLTKPIMQGA